MALSSHPKLRTLIVIGLPVGLVLFILLQFIRPNLPNPPVEADLQAPAPVKQILQTSCYNCHSNETHLAWFDRIVPGYWLVVSDVKEARKHMNFSDFGKMPVAQQRGFLYEAVNMAQLGAMPPPQYTFAHPGSVLTDAQLTVLKNYLHENEASQPADPAQIAAADAQYQKWISSPPVTGGVSPTPNGLEYFPDYRDWKPVSTTDRFDNNTFRVILGNDIATKAIADNNTHPWPDGSTFAKIAYHRLTDDKGVDRAGGVIQVEFMIKDAKKYASTEGWGFGRWRGDNHTPYGKDATFTVECTSCHAPMKDNDFVYTMPIHQATPPTDFNTIAALSDDLPYQPLQWKVITSSVDKPNATMSTLYGNDLAVTHARTSPQTPYPAGAVLALVTWQQQDDRHWFGARIPGPVQSVEFVSADNPAYTYQSYAGTPLQKQTTTDAPATQTRIDAITTARASVMP